MNRKSSSSHRRMVLRSAKWFFLSCFAVLLLAGALAMFAKYSRSQTLAANAAEQSKTYVSVVSPDLSSGEKTLDLPGTLQGEIQTSIYAHTNGYVIKWQHDIGSAVKQGEVLAEIDTPEVNQQLAQAQANRRQMQAAFELAKVSYDRWATLRKTGAVSQQGLDERQSAYLQGQANLAASDAEIKRLEKMRSFQKILAPFPGVITERNVNVGDLVGSNTTPKPLFVLTHSDTLRVFVNVPEAYAGQIKVGQPVGMIQIEYPEQVIKGIVKRTAGAIDIGSRTMRTEIELADYVDSLLPGAYVQVSLPVDSHKILTLPSSTLLFRAEGTLIATIGPDSHVRLKSVSIGRNFGSRVQLIKGVDLNDRVILNPDETISDNEAVAVLPTPKG